jgi:hypothetical protein
MVNITDYLAIYGMFEIKNGSRFEVYDNKTVNLYDWKKYENAIRINNHDLLEIVVDIQDVTFLGTKNFLDKIQEISNRLQIRANGEKVKRDAYSYCLNQN